MRSISRAFQFGALTLASGVLAVAQTTAAPATGKLARPIFVSGRVVLHDGGDLPEHIAIERVCSTNTVHSEGYTDSRGNFSFQVGQGQMTTPDASTPSTFDPKNPNGLTNPSADNSGKSISSAPFGDKDNPYWDCELRGRLAGYRSSSILLAGRKLLDSPDVGEIVLFPIRKAEGTSVSLTNAAAPKDAKKSYEKGLDAAGKKKTDDAEKAFKKAVEIYPAYADAWLELGKLLIGRKQFVEAREALNHAVAADPKYVLPHEQLYMVAFEEAKWQELADRTDALLRLNPYDFVEAYYFNGVAHFQLGHLKEAEKSLREEMTLDPRNQNPKAHYMLGWVLALENNYKDAKNELQVFAKLAPEDPAIPKVNAMLSELEQREQAEAAAPAGAPDRR